MTIDNIPRDDNAEKGFLSCVIMDEILSASIVINDEHFYGTQNRQIFQAYMNAINKGSKITIATLTSEVEKIDPSLTEHLLDVAGYEVTPLSFESHQQRLIECGVFRQTILVSSRLKKMASNELGLEMIQDEASKLLGVDLSKTQEDIVFDSVMSTLEDIATQESTDIISPTGYRKLDSMIGGLQKGKLVIVGARPSVGKSTFGQNIMYNVMQNKKRCVFFSQEMTNKDLSLRMLSRASGIPISGLHDDNAISQAAIKVDDVKESLRYGKIVTKYDTFERILTLIKKHHAEGCDVFVIDYIGILKTSKQFMNKVAQVSYMTSTLKSLANDLGVNIIGLAQLNRSSVGTPDLRHLKDSGSYEEDADQVLLLHQNNIEQGMEQSGDPALMNRGSLLEVIVAKNRSGPRGSCELMYHKNVFTLLDYQYGK